MITPEQAIDAANERFGRHPGYRAFHAKGTLCRGSFTATPEAGRLTRAAQMQGQPVEAIVRFSNGSGDPGRADYAPDVRGMATTFRLPDRSRMDIVGQTAPRFPVGTPEAFIELVLANRPGLANAWRLPLFLAKHPRSLPALRASAGALKPPPSYATIAYYPIHAFKWVDSEGGERHVRYTWRPEASEAAISTAEARERGRDYLQDEIRERLARGPVRYTLELQLAEPGDPVDDPTAVWPAERETVVAGTLELTGLEPDPEGGEGVLVFDPVRVVDGIELTDDPILRFRPRAYSESVERRTTG